MIVALIPARGGSKGIPKKNLQLIEGYPLLAYSIIAARQSKYVDRVIVSTDSEEIAAVAQAFGAEVPFLRPAEYAQDTSPDSEFVRHALAWFEQNEAVQPDLFVHLRPTTPLRDPAVIDQAILRLQQSHEATSLRSAHPCSESPFKWFRVRDGFFTGLLSDDVDALNNARQQFENVYIPDGYVDVLRASHIKRTGQLHGNKVLSFISPVCKEVDTPDDLLLIAFQAQQYKHVLLEYMKQNVSIIAAKAKENENGWR